MQLAGGIFVPFFLALLTYARCGSGDFGNADCGQQRNNSDPLLPSATPAALRPPDNQSVYPLDGRISKQQNNSTPAPEPLRPPSNSDDDDAPVSEAADTRPTTTRIPLPGLVIVGLLALFWVWVIDGTMLLRPRLGHRSGTLGRGAAEEAAAREKGGCRCRVCTLRMQARGQPLHDVSENVA